jgi:ABC-type sugar transport system ATPase subunit
VGALAVADLVVRYHDGPAALRGVSLSVEPERILAVVGPSGAGKSTLLRAIAGLIDAASGDITFDGRSLLGLAPQRRRTAIVFQDDALFPTMSVRANLAFALRQPAGGSQRIEVLARALAIDRHLDRRPTELSGGERQRVSIARALLSDPDVLLLDEPLAHLDPELRGRVRDEIVGLRERFSGPVIYVTHDHAEALSIGDDLVVLFDGIVEDAGEPERVYDAPKTLRTAAFLGDRPMNLIDASILDANDRAVLGIRPERVALGAIGVDGIVARREVTGADAYLHVETRCGLVLARVDAHSSLREGDRVSIGFPPEHVRRFDRETGRALA